MCHNVGTEPQLKPLSSEQLTLQSANRQDGARFDIATDDFWGGDRNRTFFDVVPLRRVTGTPPSANATRRTKEKNGKHMINGSEKWNMDPSLP